LTQWFLIPLCLFWRLLLRKSPSKVDAITHDLHEQKTAFIDANVRYDFSLSPGLIRFTNYHLIVSSMRFRMDKDTLFQFKNQEQYRVYFAPHSGIFLGAMSLDNQASLSPPSELLALFSEQEIEIIRLIADGLSNKEIAAALHFSVNTIKVYNSQIYEKLGVSRRTEAVAHARDIGLLP
jgi:DNA-binding CsgD family transcriptional regulator